MAITRKFLDWNRPALPAVVDELLQRYASNGRLDLSNTLIVLPGRQAGRRLLELVVDRTAASMPDFIPPRLITFSAFPEQLYEPQKSFASPLVQKLAWAQALQAADRKLLAHIMPGLPDDEDVDGWMAFGDLLRCRHGELAADGLDFDDVVQHGSDIPGFNEAERWRAMHQVQQDYLHRLDQIGLWDRETARLTAIERNECEARHDIILVGTVDMPQSSRQMLEQVADRVTALVIAPPELQELFDEFGGLKADKWQNKPVPIRNEQVRIVDRYSDQADAVVDALAALQGCYRPDEITIGTPDAGLIPRIQRRLRLAQVASRPPVDKRISETGPFRLLAAVADYLETLEPGTSDFAFRNSERFASLVRHPDMEAWLERERHRQRLNKSESQLRLLPAELETADGGWLSSLDAWLDQHLQPKFSQWPGHEQDARPIRTVFEALSSLFKPLLDGRDTTSTNGSSEIPPAEWASRLLSLLTDVYSGRSFDPQDNADRLTIHGYEALSDAIQTLAGIPQTLAPDSTASRMIRLLLGEVRSGVIPSVDDKQAVELPGWLELPLDDAPVLIVTSVNDGIIPTAVNSDPFLPDALRHRLGLDDNTRRYARDAYAMHVLLASRASLTLIMARRDVDNDPLTPSRLWFAADRDQIASRVLDFYSEAQDSTTDQQQRDVVTRGADSRSSFCIPRPIRLQVPPRRISVTAFRTYLACPYRFYLRHVLRLTDLSDSAREMNAAAFGTLLHNVLERFGRSDVRNTGQADVIRDFLVEQLDECVQLRFGRHRRAAVTVQLAQARTRLEAFAAWQARRAAEGWEIWYSEQDETVDAVKFPLADGRSVELTGRIDRIDRRDDDWMIFDYKTGDRAVTPEQAHRRAGEWIDLQLPLYVELARPHGVAGNVRLGYIALPADLSEVGDRIAGWDAADLLGALDTARAVACDVLDQNFWPPAESPPPFPDAFTRICQDSVLERESEK